MLRHILEIQILRVNIVLAKRKHNQSAKLSHITILDIIFGQGLGQDGQGVVGGGCCVVRDGWE